jgi:thiosulfate reductase cytochrome b subunit
MRLLLKSVAFGIIAVTILSGLTFTFVKALAFLEKFGGCYPLIAVFVFVSIVLSIAYYQANKRR